MKKLAFAMLALCLSLQAGAMTLNGITYTGAFYDSFKTLGKWENHWWYHTPDACEAAFEPQTEVLVPTGVQLHLQSLERFPACVGTAHTYSDAHLDARSGGVAYGVTSVGGNVLWEAKIKSSAASGTLTAWWLIPASGAWPPEIDITEIRGNVPVRSYMTHHFAAASAPSPTASQVIYVAPEAMGAAYHRYGVLLDKAAQAVVWYLDGVERARQPMAAGEMADMIPVLTFYTTACSDNWPGCPQGSGAPLKGWSADVFVDWITVWTQVPAKP